METTEKTKRIPEDKKETPEDKFEIKAYLKTEFAQLYFPCLSAEAALKKLRKWIAVNPELHRQLYGGREGKNDQTFSKRQVQLLIDVLEAP